MRAFWEGTSLTHIGRGLLLKKKLTKVSKYALCIPHELGIAGHQEA